MQPGKRIKELRNKKGLKQKELAKIIGLTQGYISDIERGRQSPSPEFVGKISGPLEISKDDQSLLLDATTAKGLGDIWPAILKENHEFEFGRQDMGRERRLPQNVSKRKLIDKVIKILDSENDTVTKALKANIKAFLYALRSEEFEPLEKNKGEGGVEK